MKLRRAGGGGAAGAKSEAGHAAVLALLQAVGEGLRLLCMYQCQARAAPFFSPFGSY
jgi:hypothetical protein